MDIASGLSAASAAITIAKDLREIDRSVDEATFKLKIAELTEALADTKIALSDARNKISEKDGELHELRNEILALKSGDVCPVCGLARMKTVRMISHPTFGEVGVQEKHLECENPICTHSEKRIHDPMGLINK
jgi:hypothetical protein